MERTPRAIVKDAVRRSEATRLLVDTFPNIANSKSYARDLLLPFFAAKNLSYEEKKNSIVFAYISGILEIFSKDDLLRVSYTSRDLFTKNSEVYTRWENKSKNGPLEIAGVGVTEFGIVFNKNPYYRHERQFSLRYGEGLTHKFIFSLKKEGLSKEERKWISNFTKHSPHKVSNVSLDGKNIKISHRDPVYLPLFYRESTFPLYFPKPNFPTLKG